MNLSANATSPNECWDGSHVNDAAQCPAYSCKDGSQATGPDFCPEANHVEDYFGPRERYVQVFGFRDKPVIVKYGADEIQTIIALYDKDKMGDLRIARLSHYAWQADRGINFTEEIWLDMGSDADDKYPVIINSENQYEIRNSGGARMVRYECLFNSVRALAKSNDEDFQDHILICDS